MLVLTWHHPPHGAGRGSLSWACGPAFSGNLFVRLCAKGAPKNLHRATPGPTKSKRQSLGGRIVNTFWVRHELYLPKIVLGVEDELYFGDASECASNLKDDFELNSKSGDEHISTRELKLKSGVRAGLKLQIDLERIMKRKCSWRATQPCKPACTHKCEAEFKSKRAFRFGLALHMDFGFAPNRIKSKSKVLVGRFVVKCLAQI